MREKKKRIALSSLAPTPLTLAEALGVDVGTVPKSSEESAPQSQNDSVDITKGVVRLFIEKKGHKGKTVTVAEGLLLKDQEGQDLLKALKRELGCGSSMEGDRVLFQGDQRQRLFTVLQQRGFHKVKII